MALSDGDPDGSGLDSCALVAMVPATDLARARAFYAGALGLGQVDGNAFGEVFDAAGTALRVVLVPELQPAPFTVAGWLVSDIRASIASLTRRGVRFEQFASLDQDDSGVWTAPGGDQVAWFKDPDGNLLSLTQATRH
jgi:catechol 2,3-dioxygenase-like lactoylglutathione lyase family enzyme